MYADMVRSVLSDEVGKCSAMMVDDGHGSQLYATCRARHPSRPVSLIDHHNHLSFTTGYMMVHTLSPNV